MPAQPGLGHMKARTPELNLGLFTWWQGPKYLSHRLLSCRMCIIVGSWIESRGARTWITHSDMGCGCLNQYIEHILCFFLYFQVLGPVLGTEDTGIKQTRKILVSWNWHSQKGYLERLLGCQASLLFSWNCVDVDLVDLANPLNRSDYHRHCLRGKINAGCNVCSVLKYFEMWHVLQKINMRSYWWGENWDDSISLWPRI